ncbi:MAG: hypothetical protein CMP54_01215, partial [Flavobacteriales bacterium]|nr:hypothetical protein [Flavobacteriales bacterium]
MKNFYLIAICIAYCLSVSFTKAQDLVWDYTVTDGNMTIALPTGSLVLDGEVLTESDPLCLVGVFYTDDNGNLACGGYTDLSVINAAISAWGNDGTSSSTDGFGAGEEMSFFMQMDGVDYAASSITWAVGSNSYATNGMNVISTIEFSSAQIELDPCTCIDGTIGTLSGGFCILPNSYCTDPLSNNYCNVEGLDVIANQVPFAEEDCSYGDVAGCTCPNADNYDSQAGSDDGSCVMEEGCSDPLANNYSLTGCSNVTIANEYCELPGCTCPSALNYDESATSDDGTCVSVVSICTDPTATNFDEGCANTTEYAASSCEYEEGGCELDNIAWDFTVTDANMTIQVAAEVVLINGAEPPCGSLLGGFYTNDSGQLVCGGYQTWCDDFSNNQLAVPLMASESGFDNGFQTGEEITWLLYIGSQTFSTNDIVMTNGGPFSETFVSNGFGQLTTANYDCDVTGILGCTDPTAYNYDSSATIDDGSCYNVDFTVTNTDCNATILIQDEDINALNISLNGDAIPVGSTIGVFYENEDGELACAGSSEWTGTATTIPAMGAEAGYDNGFQTGEEFTTFFLLIGEQIIPMDDNGAEMSTIGWQNTYSCNGFANLISVNFEGEYELTYGCTDNLACNYDSSAILDDDSCDYGQTWYQDSDGDGLGNPDVSIESCNEVTGFVGNNDDPCPDTENNPNNVTIWYLDSDGDGLGEDQIIEFGCEYIGSDDFPLADNNDDPCPYNPINEDIDGDNITDCADDCVGQYDALEICNGDCVTDEDNDGVCDDVDDCVGDYDSCGVCNGPGEIYECGCADIPQENCD